MAWSDADVIRLKYLWQTGQTASQIAADLKCTRNAVIGKANRLNLEPRKPVGKRASPKRRPWAERKHWPSSRYKPGRKRSSKPKAESQPLPVELVCPDAKMLSIMELSDHTCKWPIGDPKEPGFGFCGADKEADGTPYCAFHNDMGTRPLKQTPWTAEMKASRRRAMAERGGTTPSSWVAFKPDPAKETA